MIGTTYSAVTHPAWYNGTGKTVKITGARMLGVNTASATNYYTVTLRDDSGDTICSATTAAAMTATVGIDMGTITYPYIADDECVQVYFAQTGNGMTVAGFCIELEYEFVRSAS